MTRKFALCSALLLVSCGTSQPRTAPVPDIAPAPAPPAPAPSAVSSLPLAPQIQRPDSTAVARDSVLDAAMLDRIATAQLSDSALRPAGPPEGESAALKSFDIDVKNFEDHARVKYWIDFFTGPARERMAIWLTRMPSYEPTFRTRLVARGLPGDLAFLPLIESGYSPTAVSRSRAVGMWQFMRGTGKFYGLTVDAWVDERRDVVKATDAAIRYLADLTARFGSPYLAAAAYNGGPGRIQRGLAKLDPVEEEAAAIDSTDADATDDGAPQAGDMAFFQLADTRYIRKETKDYVPKLIAAAMIAKQPERYGFPAIVSGNIAMLDSVVVEDATGLDVLAGLIDLKAAELWELNPSFVRAITPPKRHSVIRLPNGKGAAAETVLSTLPLDDRLSGFPHHARSGETLAALGAKYSVPLATMKNSNPDLVKRAARKGEVVMIPGRARLAGWVAENRKLPLVEGANAGSHRVRAGETLGSIARKYRVSVSQLKAWNRLGSRGTIRVGQTLRLYGNARAAGPAPVRAKATTTTAVSRTAGKVHVVRTGDTLSSIARRYGVTVQAIRMANDLAPGKPLPKGRKLTIPS